LRFVNDLINGSSSSSEYLKKRLHIFNVLHKSEGITGPRNKLSLTSKKARIISESRIAEPTHLTFLI